MNPDPDGRVESGVEDEDAPPPGVSFEVLAERATALEAAFDELAASTPGLSVNSVGRVSGHEELVHPVAGFEVRLERDETELSLYVSSSYAELRQSTGAVRGTTRERFVVRLAEGFAWGDSEFPDAASLAQALVGYLQFHLDSTT